MGGGKHRQGVAKQGLGRSLKGSHLGEGTAGGSRITDALVENLWREEGSEAGAGRLHSAAIAPAAPTPASLP